MRAVRARARAAACAALCVVLGACAENEDAAAPDAAIEEDANVADAAEDAAIEDVAPDFSASELAALAELRYAGGRPPLDPSNRVAGDPAARLFGQRLFFDGAFSGPLIEGDNDGSPATLGRAGEAGRVSCAGCHIPASGFVDTRSPHKQISL